MNPNTPLKPLRFTEPCETRAGDLLPVVSLNERGGEQPNTPKPPKPEKVILIRVLLRLRSSLQTACPLLMTKATKPKST